jgi:hypothetical protein
VVGLVSVVTRVPCVTCVPVTETSVSERICNSAGLGATPRPCAEVPRMCGSVGKDRVDVVESPLGE